LGAAEAAGLAAGSAASWLFQMALDRIHLGEQDRLDDN
jgi:hypothetical protein